MSTLKITYYELLNDFNKQFSKYKTNFEQCKNKNILQEIIKLIEKLTILESKALTNEKFEIREIAYNVQDFKNEIRDYIVSLV